MISSNGLKPGMTIRQDGKILVVLKQGQNKTTRSAMVVGAKVRNLRTGSNIELSWGGDDEITPACIERKEMQYSYDTNSTLAFMDNETYKQVKVPKDRLKQKMNFTKPNDNVNISVFESGILGVIPPDKVTPQTMEYEPAVRGDTITPTSESATLEPGLEVKVPLFISQDEMILVSTSNGKYSKGAKD